MTQKRYTEIPKRQKCINKEEPYIGGAEDIVDDILGKPQSEVNQERIEDIAAEVQRAQGAESTLDGKIGAEKTRAEGVEGGLNTRLQTVEQLAEISIGGGDAQIATGVDFTNPDATKRAKVPTVGAIVDGLNDGIYDVSKRNPTAGPNSDGKFTLDYILSNADTLIPTGWRHGGMTISFVHTSDNKYIQFRCKAQSFSTNPEDWAMCSDSGLVKSSEYIDSKTDAEGRILWAIKTDGKVFWGAGLPQQLIDYINGDNSLRRLLNEKVDKVAGKGLSTNDFTNKEKEIVDTQEITENSEYIEIKTDNEGRILETRKRNGSKEVYTDIYFPNGIPTDIKEYVNNASHNMLFGKKWVSCGDSFTEGDFAGSPVPYIFSDEPYKNKKKVYPFFIGRRCGMNIVNEAKSGTTMAYINGQLNEFTKPNGRYTQIPEDADYITLWFGINDSHQQVPIGTINDDVNTTFYGAWNVALGYIREHHPKAKLGIIISNACDTSAYPIATRAVAKKWGIPYLDIDGDYQVPLMLRTVEKTDVDATLKQAVLERQAVNYPTNIHPNVDAHEFESFFIESWLMTL